MGAMRPTSEYCFQADYSWAITILPMRDASPPFVLEFESEEPVSTARPRLHISHAHDVGKHTGCCHIGAGTITLNEHGVFVVALGGEQ